MSGCPQLSPGSRFLGTARQTFHFLHEAVQVNTRRAVGMRSTKFVRQLLNRPEGATIALCVAQCRQAEDRVCDG